MVPEEGRVKIPEVNALLLRIACILDSGTAFPLDSGIELIAPGPRVLDYQFIYLKHLPTKLSTSAMYLWAVKLAESRIVLRITTADGRAADTLQ